MYNSIRHIVPCSVVIPHHSIKILGPGYDIPGTTTSDKKKEKVVQCVCNTQ